MSLKLYSFIKPTRQPSPSGFCQKLETFLRATEFTDYELVFCLPFTAPKWKLPYITFKGDTVADSHFIIQHLLRNGVVKDLDADLTPAQRAHSRAMQAYIEELVYPATLQMRIGDPKNRPAIEREVFGWIYWPIRPVLLWYMKRRALAALKGHGVGRHTVTEIQLILKDFVGHLEECLKAYPSGYFHNTDVPTAIDTVIYGFLANALGTESNPYYTMLILESETIRKYVSSLTKKWFPEYLPLLERV